MRSNSLLTDVWALVPGNVRDFLIRHHFKIDSGIHIAFHPIKWNLSPGYKGLVHRIYQSSKSKQDLQCVTPKFIVGLYFVFVTVIKYIFKISISEIRLDKTDFLAHKKQTNL